MVRITYSLSISPAASEGWDASDVVVIYEGASFVLKRKCNDHEKKVKMWSIYTQ